MYLLDLLRSRYVIDGYDARRGTYAAGLTHTLDIRFYSLVWLTREEEVYVVERAARWKPFRARQLNSIYWVSWFVLRGGGGGV